MRFVVILLLLAVSLSGCMTITKQIRNTVTNADHYPSARAKNESVSDHPPEVLLSNYKSVSDSLSRPYQTPKIAVALASSGGGYRASNLLIGVLLGLEQYHDPGLNGNLLENIDYISSVSGSNFGVGYYLSRLYAFKIKHFGEKPMPHFSLKEQVADLLKYPAQKIDGNYTGRGNVLNINLSSMIDLGANHYDKYETILNDAVLNNRYEPFVLGDDFIPVDSSKPALLPLWLVNATIYQNMGIFRFSPRVLAHYQIRGYRHLGTDHVLAKNYADPMYGMKLPYSVALAASSSVPFAMSSTTLTSDDCINECYMQLFDGGLSDNLGLDSAYQMLVQDKAPIKLLIIVDASGEKPHAYSKFKASPGIFSLMWRIMNSGIDATHLIERNNAKKFAHAMLCQAGAKNVIVAYLDLSSYPDAYKIPTSLHISNQQQLALLKIGQQLVAKDKALQDQLKQVLAGNLKVDSCSAKIDRNPSVSAAVGDLA